MEEGRLLKEVMKWRPPGRRKRGEPKRTWADGIRGLVGEKGLMEDDWNDDSNWRKKILQCVPLATEPGISLIILSPMKILQEYVRCVRNEKACIRSVCL